MDIKKLNEELQKYIINELDKSSMDNAFYRRFDNYINKGSKSKSESAYKESKKILDDLSGWNVDEMEVIRNTKG